MKLKNISRLLSIGLLLNSFNLNSFAGILSEDGRYETFIENNITVEDVLEEDKVDAKIEGNTMVNIMEKVVPKGISGTFLENNGIYRITRTTTENKQYLQFEFNNGNMLKPDTIYTVIIPKYNTNCSSEGQIRLYDRTNEEAIGDYKKIDDGIYTIKTIPNLNISNSRIQLLIYVGDDKELDRFVECSNEIMMFEGNLTNNLPTEYFEGMQSSFENQLITQEMINSGEEKAENLGKYKVEVKSTGKNLFNKNNVIKNKYQNHNIANSQFIISDNVNFDITGFIKIKPNTTYKTTNLAKGAYYDKNKKPIISAEVGDTLFTTPYNAHYIVLNIDKWVDYDTIQLEEGSIATPYEPYKESINTFYLNSPLLQGDTIEYINGQAYHVKRNGQMLLDGSDDEDWFHYGDGSQDRDNTALFANRDFIDRLENSTIICDKFKTGYKNITVSDEFGSIESLWGHNYNIYKNHLYFRINTSKLHKVDFTGFKQWLSENPITVVYKLENPIYEQIKADLSVQLFEGTTHISNNSNIPVNIEIMVDRVLNRAVEAIELAKTNPTVANMSLARMWINLAKESVKKDELQNKIDAITDIEDLQIEKKSVTSNMDIYIKPLNSLSISLSTNQIIFEDYSSVSDLDMNNALQISINSSLPYDLNSYLETEIQNSYGSNIINKDLLHIKDDTESEYKQFLGINQKLILKEDCEAGSNNIHNIDLKLKASAHDADIYKATIKFEAEQK